MGDIWEGGLHGVSNNGLDYDIVCKYPCNYVHFRTNTFGKGMNSLFTPSYGLNSTTIVFLLRWPWHYIINEDWWAIKVTESWRINTTLIFFINSFLVFRKLKKLSKWGVIETKFTTRFQQLFLTSFFSNVSILYSRSFFICRT